MRASRSMENLEILPEEAKLAAACLFRLTVSNNRETPTDIQSYIGKHCEFPYHKVVQKSKQVETKGTPANPKTQSQHGAKISFPEQAVKNKCVKVQSDGTALLSDNAADENHGFFHRLVPSFIRRKSQSQQVQKVEEQNEYNCQQSSTDMSILTPTSEEDGYIIYQFTRVSWF